MLLFRSIPVFHVPRERIKAVEVVPLRRLILSRRCLKNMFGFALGNRISSEVLVLTTDYMISRWYFTPPNRAKAAAALRMPEKQQ